MEKSKMPDIAEFHLEISSSGWNHLGRDLYRNFITVIGEAISNSWDGGAENVWINIGSKKLSFSIKDDGSGMAKVDFQNKFLKIGYSKHEDGNINNDSGRLHNCAALARSNSITLRRKIESIKTIITLGQPLTRA